MELSLRQLEYLAAVEEHRNFTRAAVACDVTQPTLSERLRRLEASIGTRLFDRDCRPITLTPAGVEVARQARRVLDEVRRLEDLSVRLRGPLAGALHLGVIPTIAPYALPRCMHTIRDRCPELRLYLLEDQTDRLLEKLEAGDLDVVLLALEAELGQVDTLPLLRDPFLFAGPAGHPFSDRSEIVEADLVDQHVLLLDDGHCMRDQALLVCEKSNTQDVDNFRAGSLRTLVQMVSSGLGVTLIPEIARDVEVAATGSARMTIRPFAEPAPARTIGLAWRTGSARADEFRMLGEAIREAIAPSSQLA